MEYIIFAAAMLALVVIFMLKGFFDYKKSEEKFREKLYSDYGALPQREYKPEQFANISHYFLKHQEGFYIDDITWNDLNMDEVFKRMNYTHSSAGEEYLYDILRKPCMAEKELQRREELIEYFRTHSDERVGYQFVFHNLGRMGKFSIYDYLDYLDQLGERSNLPHYLALLLLFLSIAGMFINLPIGLCALVCVLIYNNISYFRIKNEIEPYITSFAYIFRILECVKQLQTKKLDILNEEFEILKKCSSSMNGYRAGSFLLMSGGRMSGSGNPLDILLDFIRMGFHLDLMKFNQMLSEVRRHITEIDQMITILGKIEAMISIGEYRESLEKFSVPVFTEKAKIQADGLYHPLLKDPVKNSFSTDKSVLITGSNASGKSTFLKTVALNAILAQTIHTCLADQYTGGIFRVVSSMSLRDDVQGGDSYYMVEIKAIKRIMDMVREEGIPVICFVDEVLRGTNTVERIAASTQILKSMAEQNCICFAATHDIELTNLLEEFYNNYHFSEEIEENDISFSYKIMKGRAQTRNAIKLLGIMGYSQDIIKAAENMAGNFLKNGVWQSLD
ncbi:MAG: hypothetical protein PUG54_02615 [Firmicutes bacterium]|nr:hypothetical protein [Bacillota bacterium]